MLVDEHSSSEELPYKFNGKELDEETGLYYYGARYMQPVASIWYGVDPLAEKYANVSGYTYCLGNPIRLIDPDGNGDKDDDSAISVTLSLGFRFGALFDNYDADIDFGSVNYSWNSEGECNSFISTGWGIGTEFVGFESRNIYTESTNNTGIKSMALGEIKENVETVTSTNQLNFGPGFLRAAVGQEKETVKRSVMGHSSVSTNKQYFARGEGSFNQNDATNEVDKRMNRKGKSRCLSVNCFVGVSLDVDYNAIYKKIESNKYYQSARKGLSNTWNRVVNKADAAKQKVATKYREYKNKITNFMKKIL